MSEIADMMIEGLIDSETGELIDGDSPGYPRSVNWPGSVSFGRQKKKSYKPGPVVSGKVQCPQCSKRVKAAGLKDHLRDKHGVGRA